MHRHWLGFRPAKWRFSVPRWAIWPLTLLADALGWLGWRSPLRSNAIAALMNGVSGDGVRAETLLGRPLLALPDLLAGLPAAGKADRWHARLALIYPVALFALLILWLGSGLLGLMQIDNAAALLSAKIDPGIARMLVIGGSIADITIGLGLLYRPWLKRALLGNVAMTIAYCVGAALLRPDLWLDPLAPMLKTIPALILSCGCLAMANER
jgi:hypothetical protein